MSAIRISTAISTHLPGRRRNFRKDERPMIESWRWFGPRDPVSLRDVRQTGARGIVTALHEIANGAAWPEDAIAARRQMIEAAGLELAGDREHSGPRGYQDRGPRLGAPGRGTGLKTAKALARIRVCGRSATISCRCWTGPAPISISSSADGATALRFEFRRLCRLRPVHPAARWRGRRLQPGRHGGRGKARYAAMSGSRHARRLTATIIAGLPGSEESYTLDTFRERLAAYQRPRPGRAVSEPFGTFLEARGAGGRGRRGGSRPSSGRSAPLSVRSAAHCRDGSPILKRIAAMHSVRRAWLHPVHRLARGASRTTIIPRNCRGPWRAHSLRSSAGPPGAKVMRAVSMRTRIWKATSTWSPSFGRCAGSSAGAAGPCRCVPITVTGF